MVRVGWTETGVEARCAAAARAQVTDPPTEAVTLDDYRWRYRQSRADPSLQLLGSRVPLIAVPDDHDGEPPLPPRGAFKSAPCPPRARLTGGVSPRHEQRVDDRG